MGFAGLWERRRRTIESCAIIITSANDMTAELHNRMPVILDPDNFDWWMTGSVDEVGQLLTSCLAEWLDAYAIDFKVNNPRNEGPGLNSALSSLK
jgi:putative SOS response-associated peptidase YedK